MPSERFFNLPKEKRDRIVEASIAEFSRVPFDQISINRIIQDAGIPRGSFYQYFRNKEDLSIYLVGDFIKRAGYGIKEYLRQDLGDLFHFFSLAYDFIVEELKKNDNTSVYKNMAPQLFSQKSTIFNDEIITNMIALKKDFLVEMNKRYYSDYALEELDILWDILWGFFKDAVCMVVMWNCNQDEIKVQYEKKLEIVKKGFQK